MERSSGPIIPIIPISPIHTASLGRVSVTSSGEGQLIMAEGGTFLKQGEQRTYGRFEEAHRLREQSRAVNLGKSEQYGSLILGGGMITAGFARRGLSGAAMIALGTLLVRRGFTGHSPLYERFGVSTAPAIAPGVPDNVGIKVERKITINRSPAEIFGFWRDFRNLPRFMKHLERVEIVDSRRSRWVSRAPAGRIVEWDAEIINEHPNELIAWQSLPGADIENAGSVRFTLAPGGRGTEVKVDFEYNPPGGVFGALAAKLFGEAPEQQVEDDLMRLKQVLEAGELATTEGQPAGRSRKRGRRI